MVEHQSEKFPVFSLVIREFETTETGSHLTAPSTIQSISFCISQRIARNPRACARFALTHGPRERLLRRHSPESSESYPLAILLGPSARPSGWDTARRPVYR